MFNAMALDLSVCLLTYSNKKQNNESHLFLQSEQTEASRRRLAKFMKTLNELLFNIGTQGPARGISILGEVRNVEI